jgi:hypothetical protein
MSEPPPEPPGKGMQPMGLYRSAVPWWTRLAAVVTAVAALTLAALGSLALYKALRMAARLM